MVFQPKLITVPRQHLLVGLNSFAYLRFQPGHVIVHAYDGIGAFLDRLVILPEATVGEMPNITL